MAEKMINNFHNFHYLSAQQGRATIIAQFQAHRLSLLGHNVYSIREL